MGLPSGTLWATCNVGAENPEEYGDYFAWGETEPKSVYNWSTYKWCNGSAYTLTKYCTDSSYGTFHNRTELDPEDDAAYVNWGPSWRMPTNAQQDELREKCTWIWTTRNGVNGQLVTGPNGASLFMPVAGLLNGHSHILAGYGYYWSRTLVSSNPGNAYNVYFNSEDIGRSNHGRAEGLSVRAVRVSQN